MGFKCPYEPRDASTCANCPIFDECLKQNTERADEDDSEREDDS